MKFFLSQKRCYVPSNAAFLSFFPAYRNRTWLKISVYDLQIKEKLWKKGKLQIDELTKEERLHQQSTTAWTYLFPGSKIDIPREIGSWNWRRWLIVRQSKLCVSFRLWYWNLVENGAVVVCWAPLRFYFFDLLCQSNSVKRCRGMAEFDWRIYWY